MIKEVPPEMVRQIILEEASRGHIIDAGQLFIEVRARIQAVGTFGGPQAIEIWNDLIRQGLVVWGTGYDNPAPPWFHVTTRGQKVLQNYSQDPSNTEGYLRYLYAQGNVNAIARSYIEEAVDTYNAGFKKSAALNLGIASESLVLELRDELVSALGDNASKKLKNWQLKPLIAAIETELNQLRANFPRELDESVKSTMGGVLQRIRTIRNDTGHAVSVEPVTLESVHAGLLLFPHETRLIYELIAWLRDYSSHLASA